MKEFLILAFICFIIIVIVYWGLWCSDAESRKKKRDFDYHYYENKKNIKKLADQTKQIEQEMKERLKEL